MTCSRDIVSRSQTTIFCLKRNSYPVKINNTNTNTSKKKNSGLGTRAGLTVICVITSYTRDTRQTVTPKSVHLEQFWQPKLVPLAKNGPHTKLKVIPNGYMWRQKCGVKPKRVAFVWKHAMNRQLAVPTETRRRLRITGINFYLIPVKWKGKLWLSLMNRKDFKAPPVDSYICHDHP